MRKLIIFIGLAVFFSGCASKLKTYDSKGGSSFGIPFATPVLVKITEKTSYEVVQGEEANKKYCTPEINVKYESLALGEQGYIGFDPACFGKGEFRVEFNDAGVPKVVTLNSDATAAAGDVSSFLQAVLPYIAAARAAAVPGEGQRLARPDTAQKMKETYCLKTKTEVEKVERAKIE